MKNFLKKNDYLILIFFIIYLICNAKILFAIEEEPKKSFFYNNNLQIIENSSYCHVGYGGQSYNITHNEIKYRPNDNILNFDFNNSTYLQIGCGFNFFSFDYSSSEFFLVPDQKILLENDDYQRINFHMETISVGYNFGIIKHFLYLGLGIENTYVEYQFINDKENLSSQVFQSNYFLLFTHLRYFFNTSFFINWKFEKSLNNTPSIIDEISTISVSYYLKF